MEVGVRLSTVPVLVLFATAPTASASSWFATSVVSYTAGSGAAPGHRQPQAALGEPSRLTGFTGSPEAVTPFQPAYRPDQVVSIGAGGQLTLELGTPATDDPGHRFGVDLIVFGNAFFTDMVAGTGTPLLCAGEGGHVEVSADGQSWSLVPDLMVDGPLPTLAWIDAGPYDTQAGQVPTDFLRAVDPAVTSLQLEGLSYPEVVAAYDGGGGGVGVDLASVGLASARFVRFSHPSGAAGSPEIDAVAVVPPARDPADLDGNGVVDAGDIGSLLVLFGTAGPQGDLDGSGGVDSGDIGALLLRFS
jgi:hypothetical protein